MLPDPRSGVDERRLPGRGGRTDSYHAAAGTRHAADLEQREAALRAAEDLAQLGTWTRPLISETVVWSPVVHRILGTDPEGPPLTFDAVMGMMPADDRLRFQAVLAETRLTFEPYQVDYRIIRSDGSVREVQGRGRIDLDEEGRPVRLNGSLQDVTELRALTREFQRSRDLFAGVINATQQAIIATDAAGLINVFSVGAERMLGYTAAEMIGKYRQRLHEPDEIAARAAELGVEPGVQVLFALAATGVTETRLWHLRTSFGRRCEVSITVTPILDAGSRVAGYLIVGTDITECLVGPNRRSRPARRGSGTFDNAPIGMMVFGVGEHNMGRFLQVNPALCRLTGYTEHELMTMALVDPWRSRPIGSAQTHGSPN